MTQHLCLAVIPSARPPNLASENLREIELFLSMCPCAESLFTIIGHRQKDWNGSHYCCDPCGAIAGPGPV